MVRLILLRGALVAAPFVIWFVWRWWARRTGREVGATPWGWLVAVAGVLLGLSLMASAVFHEDTRGLTYVPGKVGPGGEVSEGRYVEPAPK